MYTTSVVRDGNGDATQVTQGNSVVTNYAYDDINRLTSFTTHPTGVLNLTTSYVLDGNGNPTQRTTADTVQTNYQYDAMSRLKLDSGPRHSTKSLANSEIWVHWPRSRAS